MEEEKETLEGQVGQWRKKATALELEVGMWMKAVKEKQVLREQEKERREKGGEKRWAENRNFKKVMMEGMMKLDGGGRI